MNRFLTDLPPDLLLPLFLDSVGCGRATCSTLLRPEAGSQLIVAINRNHWGAPKVEPLAEGPEGEHRLQELRSAGWIAPLTAIRHLGLPASRFFGKFKDLPLEAVEYPKTSPMYELTSGIALVRCDLDELISKGHWGLFARPFHPHEQTTLRILRSRDLREKAAAMCVARMLATGSIGD